MQAKSRLQRAGTDEHQTTSPYADQAESSVLLSPFHHPSAMSPNAMVDKFLDKNTGYSNTPTTLNVDTQNDQATNDIVDKTADTDAEHASEAITAGLTEVDQERPKKKRGRPSGTQKSKQRISTWSSKELRPEEVGRLVASAGFAAAVDAARNKGVSPVVSAPEQASTSKQISPMREEHEVPAASPTKSSSKAAAAKRSAETPSRAKTRKRTRSAGDTSWKPPAATNDSDSEAPNSPTQKPNSKRRATVSRNVTKGDDAPALNASISRPVRKPKIAAKELASLTATSAALGVSPTGSRGFKRNRKSTGAAPS
ncbi:MAG: hypothetical protein INR71_02455 [Terriglobus roseus]|nr:hypothetical protein [Terriglobus roseus]